MSERPQGPALVAKLKKQVADSGPQLNIAVTRKDSGPGHCLSCNEKTKPHEASVCDICADAKWKALFGGSARPRLKQRGARISMFDAADADDDH